MKYEKALKIAKNIYFASESKDILNTLSSVFPELKESEDERIRTFLHHTFTAQYLSEDKLSKWHGEPVVNILTWLEKQGEHAIACSEEQMKVLDEVLNFAANHESSYWNDYIFGTLNSLIRQLTDGLQKSNEQFKGQFKAAINRLEKQSDNNNQTWKPSKDEMDVLYGLAYITNQYDEHKEEVITRLYQDLKREFFNGSSYENMFPNTEDDVRRRSIIQVLEYVKSLDAYNQYGKADIDKNIAWLEKQCDVNALIQEASEKSYTEGMRIERKRWLEKQGEQKNDWTEEDEKMFRNLHSLIYVVRDCDCDSKEKLELSVWFNSLKNRVQPQSKREWSEEDEEFFNDTIAFFKNSKNALEHIDWLKSLKERIGG